MYVIVLNNIYVISVLLSVHTRLLNNYGNQILCWLGLCVFSFWIVQSQEQLTIKMQYLWHSTFPY